MTARAGRAIGILLALAWPPDVVEAQERARKEARASRAADGMLTVDGRLDEPAWQSAPAVTDFVQRNPDEGSPPSDGVDVRFLFDGAALYVGARMEASGPIQAPLGRRDDVEQAEHLLISLDTYLDRRTAYTFGVTANGVRLDVYYASDNDSADDDTYTPVWEARTRIDATGWTAEMRIPFSQLRFTLRAPQVWGLNIRRWVPSRNEEVFWSPVRRTDERWASLFGNLVGLDIAPRRRLELLPYAATSTRAADAHSGSPFDHGVSTSASFGGDVKIGLGSNLTLEATVNPDFGQVEADPAQVNLSAFEVFFDERRPFFVEGANLLSGTVNNYFYSRRIGAAPQGRSSAEFAAYPTTTTILGAAKLTGRLSSGTSLGVLAAVTDQEDATTLDGGVLGRARVAPRTFSSVTRLEQQLGRQASSVALMATAVHRDLDPADPLSALLTRNAFTLSSDAVLRFGNHEVQAFMGGTYVDGEPGALLRLQRSSARFFQRPDADYVRLDPARRRMSGAKGGVSVERQNGRHWLWEGAASFETPEFETNDLGRLATGDGMLVSGELEYQETEPGAWYRAYSASVERTHEWNFGGQTQTARVEVEAGLTWPNFWETELTWTRDARRQDMRLTRGGPSMQVPASWATELSLETRDGAQTQGSATALYGRTEDGGLTVSAESAVAVRPSPQWQLSVGPSYVREVDTQQYVDTLGGGPAETFGRRYVFGHLDRSTWSARIRLNYTFVPDLNLDFYAEPFAASGRYESLGVLAAPRTRIRTPLPLDAQPSEDFEIRSFRSNLVLRWEWRPGSFLFLVWQQNRSSEIVGRSRASVGGLLDSFGDPGDHFFAVKATLWRAR